MERALDIVTTKAIVLKNLFDVLKDIIYDGNLVFDDTGLKFSAVDGHQVAFVDLILPATWFDEYHCESKMYLGVSLKNLHTMIKTANNHDIINMYMKDGADAHLNICITSNDRCQNVFELKLIEENTQGWDMNDLEFDAVFTLQSAWFHALCKNMGQFDDYITIMCDDDGLTFKCSGDIGSRTTTINPFVNDDSDLPATLVQQSGDDREDFTGTYATRYLILFNKATVLSSTVFLYLKRSLPLIMKFNVGSDGELKFCLVPQLDPEESVDEESALSE